MWYFAFLAGYCIGYAAYASTAALGLPGGLAMVLGVVVGIMPPSILIRRHIHRRRRRAASRAVRAAAVPPPAAWAPNLDLAELKQRPIPCRCCGAAMAPVELSGDIERVQCLYCYRIDDVPHDAAGRIAFLRSRAAELRAARQELTDADRRAVALIEDGTWLRGTLLAALGPTATIVVLVVLPGVYATGWFGMMIGMGLLAQLASVVLGMALAYRAVGRRYRRVVRPRILARAPERAGAPARCRICGGPVEVRHSPFVACEFCGAANVVTRELVHECGRFLDAEIAEYRYRASAAGREIEAHHRLLRRGVVLGNVLGSLVGGNAVYLVIWIIAR